MNIGKTTNYDFKIVSGWNRPVKEEHVKSLMKSIMLKDSTHVFPIVVNRNNVILDGQHRYEALKRLGKPIHYILYEGEDIDWIKLVNNNQRQWTVSDYLEAEISNGNKDYIDFKEFCLYYGMSYNLMLSIIFSSSGIDMNKNKHFKSGLFKMPSDNIIDNFFLKLIDIEKYTEFEARSNSYFIRSCIKLFKKENYNHKRLIDKLQKNNRMIKKCSSIDEYFLIFNEIYNFNVKKSDELIYLK
jgi:hypothetical protein